jgi:hypothetical protein
MSREKVIAGVLLNKMLVIKKDKNFYKFEVGVQTGYKMKVETIYQFGATDEAADDYEKLVIGSDVLVNAEVTDRGYDVLKRIEETMHAYCKKCEVNVTIDDVDPSLCEGCLKPEQERLSGRWLLKDRSEFTLVKSQSTAVKLYLEQEEKKLCLVAFPGAPFFEVMNDIAIGDNATIDGWRNDIRHSTIWNFSKCPKPKPLKRKRV